MDVKGVMLESGAFGGLGSRDLGGLRIEIRGLGFEKERGVRRRGVMGRVRGKEEVTFVAASSRWRIPT